MSSASLTVEVAATIKVHQTIDLVELFSRLSDREQDRYRSLDITDLGFEAEWERPLAFLWPEEDEVVPASLAPVAQTAVWGDIDDASIRLRKRGDEPVYGRAGDWTEADFEALAEQVPWLRAFHDLIERAEQESEPADEDAIARIPGPDDQPLF